MFWLFQQICGLVLGMVGLLIVGFAATITSLILYRYVITFLEWERKRAHDA